MADIVDDFIWTISAGRQSRAFPLDEWKDGRTRILTRGVDSEPSTLTAQNTIYQAARRAKIRVRTRVLDENRIAVKVR
jgi:hypothetical protein